MRIASSPKYLGPLDQRPRNPGNQEECGLCLTGEEIEGHLVTMGLQSLDRSLTQWGYLLTVYIVSRDK